MYVLWASKVIPDMCIYQLTTAVTDPRSTIYYKLIQLRFLLRLFILTFTFYIIKITIDNVTHRHIIFDSIKIYVHS